KTDVSYDIINVQTNEVVYSYRNGEVTGGELNLPEGQYILRLYYWDNINQSGAIVADELEQSIAEPTPEETASGESIRKTHTPGSENTLGDGSVVYDVPFEVKATAELLDESSQQYHAALNFYIADPQTAQNNDTP